MIKPIDTFYHIKILQEIDYIGFRQCLDELATVNIKSVVISHNIGCRLGGGDWADYFNIISDFALRTNIEIVISIPRFAK